MTDLLFRKPSVGKEILSHCGRCKDERTHIVTAMDGDVVRRVTCSTCGSTHNHKQAPAKRPARASTGRPRSEASAHRQPFRIDPHRPVRNYDMHASFSEGEVISHPKFGLGEVQTSLAPNKIEVRFTEGTRLLLHNMKAAGS